MYWDYAGPTVIADTSSLTTRRPWYSMVYNDAVQGLALSPYGMTDASRYQVQHLAGQKQYELSNHLGNVQATVSDLPVKVGEAHTEYHAPALPAVYDYYPFGMLMPDRYTSDTSSECVTVSQTKWVTTWVTHCYLAADWVWPAYSYYGSVSVSTSSGLQIAAGESSGIYFEIDVLPYEQQDVYLQTDAFYSGSGTLELQEYHGGQWHMLGSTTFDKLGEVRISIRPREDRIRAVLRGPFYVQVKQFCVQRPQLSQETVLVDICDTDGDKYRFGFNGMYKDNELKGIGNSYDFGARMYGSRETRWMSLDPLAAKYPNLSPYAFSFNNPIYFIDLNGEKGIASIAEASGTKKDPVVVTVTANYYFKTATDAQKRAMGSVQSDLKRPKSFKDANGRYYSVIINVSFTQSDNPAESAAKDIGQNGFGYGNVFNIDEGMGNNSGESGHESNTEIAVFDGGVKAKAQNWSEGDNEAKSYQTIFRNILIEEVLHNLGGLHQDGGAVPPMTNYTYGRRSMTEPERPASENTYSSGNAEAIFMRIDKPLGTDAKENPKDKKGRDVDPPLRDESGTVGEVRIDKLPGQ